MTLRPPALAASVALVLGTFIHSSTSAQQAPAPSAPTVELADSPLNLPGIALEIRLPLGSTSTQQSISREVFADILGEDSQWRMTISTRTSSNKDLTPLDAATQIRDNLLESFAITDVKPNERAPHGTFARTLDEVAPVAFGGGEAYRFLIEQPPTTPELPATVRGVAVVGIGPGQMLVWDMTAPRANYETAKAALDATLGGLVAVDASLAVPEREVAIKTGHALVRGIAPERLRAVFSDHGERFYRLFRENGDTGTETEIGYRRVRAWAGKRSDVGGAGSLSAAEGQIPGYVVEIGARSLDEGAEGPDQMVYDSKGTYFVSEDFTKEAWNLVVVIKRGKQSTTYTEVGAREGFEELLITTATPTGSNESFRLQIQEEGYLPMPMMLILPSVLAETKATGDVAFYTYRSDANAVTFRHDSIRHDTVNPDRYVHQSSVSLDSPRSTKQVDASGLVLREDLPGGRVWLPTDVKELVRIWKAKGLPMN